MQNQNLKKIIISPPFGKYIKFKETSNVYGSFTVNRRWGLIKQAIKTIRKIEKNAWRNKIGLRNPGLANIKPPKRSQDIISLAALEIADWHSFAATLETQKFANHKNIEINIGCPNARIADFPAELAYLFEGRNIIIKMPPTIDINTKIRKYVEIGITTFHLCNTIPTDKGGVSGYPLQKYTLPAIKAAREEFGNNITIIGGGGIYTLEDAQKYLDAGADHLSLSTVLFNPIKARKLIKRLLYIEDY
ncbi:diguanylate cyclase [Allofrancisella guangzhouensis]|uniref:Diguanylate cyclase n=1 Tax=Allofrancisella guangzhouensis TaxID=594679 RepID=A0A0A8E315_9GAMM|nr:HisA/HisF-related TIM barrel protein [Allofrancisella guangzhouensis]AJC48364.1 diguanylate cyclase [Allofrancisella guangzhouensis]MBK2026541.1 diguanylate cyclase [Allofrancisella guangzhouensis]MBK2044285.1 diguanylate cyclase [Allofrancisella guangzhouensis]MBK2045528.1 diguanylate cyclase [Allofrancisella guangzhouensis]